MNTQESTDHNLRITVLLGKSVRPCVIIRMSQASQKKLFGNFKGIKYSGQLATGLTCTLCPEPDKKSTNGSGPSKLAIGLDNIVSFRVPWKYLEGLSPDQETVNRRPMWGKFDFDPIMGVFKIHPVDFSTVPHRKIQGELPPPVQFVPAGYVGETGTPTLIEPDKRKEGAKETVRLSGEIIRKLTPVFAAHFNERTRVWHAGWSDEQAALESNLTHFQVKQYREVVYPVRQDVLNLRADLDAAQVLLTQLKDRLRALE